MLDSEIRNKITEQKNNIINNIQKNIVGDVEKSVAVIGEIREWKDGKYIKTINNWTKLPNHLQHLQKATKGILDILNSGKPIKDQLNDLMNHGLTNEEALVNATGANLSEVIKQKHNHPANNLTHVDVKLQQSVVNSIQTLPRVDVNKRWASYELFSDMVVDGHRKGLIAYGTGGVGKTYTINKVLEGKINEHTGAPYRAYDEELDPDASEYDYIKVTGKTSPPALYKTLYEHNKKIIIFDDCDTVLDDMEGIGILKGAIDTSGDGTITYATSSPMKGSDGDPIPQRFKFRGQVIFITNIPDNKMKGNPHLAALLSRTFPIGLTMTAEETIERLNSIKYKIPFENNQGKEIEVSEADRDAAVKFLDKYKNAINISKLNARTLGSIALTKRKIESDPKSYAGLNWEEAAINLIQ